MLSKLKQIHQVNYTINYRVYGSGKPVVLVHGYGEDSGIWQHQLNALASFCKVIVPDIPGSGLSTITAAGMQEWLTQLSINALADCINECLIAEDIANATILGHSMGGYIGLAFAANYPYKINALGLVHSTAYADSEEKKLVRQKSMQFILTNGGLAFFKTSMINLFGKAFQASHPSTIESLIEATKQFDAPILVAYTKAMMERPNQTQLLSTVAFPILFIAGPEDIAAPLTDVQTQATLPNKSYLEVMDGVGHMGMLEAPDLMNKHLSKFIRMIE